LRLSVLALHHNLVWVEQTVCILRRPSSSLREYVVAIQAEDNRANNARPLPIQLMTILQSSLANASSTSNHCNGQEHVIVPPEDLKHAVDLVCSPSSHTPVDEKPVSRPIVY
jgi:hypothetical protein